MEYYNHQTIMHVRLTDGFFPFVFLLSTITGNPIHGLRKVLIPLQLDQHGDALSDAEASLKLSPTSLKALRTRARLNLSSL